MVSKTSAFYDDLADYYHLIYEDWNKSIERQATVLNGLVSKHTQQSCVDLLDCACGIGTQAIGFAQAGHRVVASDLSRAALDRAKREAKQRGLDISFFISDMTSLGEIPRADFDVVVALDNPLPHLTAIEIGDAVRAMGSKLKPHGLFIASIRDYDKLILQRPAIQEPAFYGDGNNRRIVHQVWEWIDDKRYIVHLYITTQSGNHWVSHHFVSEYRSLLRSELSSALECAGFEQVQWLMPEESGFYQPIVIAKMGRQPLAVE
jgi:SAM-dependent methyltransferase